MHLVHASRLALAEALLAAGPSADTLCAGWQARHLAAHLVLRENSPLGAGVLIKPLSGKLESRLQELANDARKPENYIGLVRRFRAGPGKYSPFSIERISSAANLSEFFIHTEDIRRARTQWAPRVLDREYTEMLWHDLTKRARIYYRHSPVGVILARPNGEHCVAKKAANPVTITGPVAELLLHASGRGDSALVTFEGSDESIKSLKKAKIGF
ncbi:TIGR03085 family metal-binding protein [Glutamicibacter sp. MNS18]|uniref:TIGR03085 family metal-binding protein n=1 Tax=Glutamicibacter sp. MNS18 TaxID=2989817 RepID=UPI00223549FC|nr:TIGR03085 family metal-binding protein [Glutamicibacter sp. MNS18]MCW4464526.1 TIGR03085 family metal-binding protein [Glutamicibacter sp. MNS18]